MFDIGFSEIVVIFGLALVVLGPDKLPRVAQTLDEIKPRLADATSRERLHVRALEAWAAGDIMAACASWEQVL